MSNRKIEHVKDISRFELKNSKLFSLFSQITFALLLHKVIAIIIRLQVLRFIELDGLYITLNDHRTSVFSHGLIARMSEYSIEPTMTRELRSSEKVQLP